VQVLCAGLCSSIAQGWRWRPDLGEPQAAMRAEAGDKLLTRRRSTMTSSA